MIIDQNIFVQKLIGVKYIKTLIDNIIIWIIDFIKEMDI